MEEVVPEVDVVSYLSFSGGELVRRDGARVGLNLETFKGKCVWVCCFHVPLLQFSCNFCPIINLCHELYSTRSGDFEMVVVARMNGLANTRAVFDHFFSGFHESCLAVPFEDGPKRDYICKVLGLGSYYRCYRSLFLDEEGRVSNNFLEYGADAFPFTEAMLAKKDEERRSFIEHNRVGLEDVLKCDVFVRKFNSSDDIGENVPISNLGNKHVGLYLCWDGWLAPDLWKMWLQCRESNKEFEVVVVYMPYDTNLADPKKVDSWLQESNISGWWLLPFNYSLSCWLAQLTSQYQCSGEYMTVDKLIVVGPGVDKLDMYAGIVMRRQGIDAFPFTVAAGVKAAKEKLLKTTLESLFVDGATFFRGKDRKDFKSLHQLVNGGKKIVVCIDQLYDDYNGCCNWDWQWGLGRLASFYSDLVRAGRCDFEMVFVEVGSEDRVAEADRERYVSKMPWYVCPRHEANSRLVDDLSCSFSPVADRQVHGAVIGFGFDGRLCSYNFKQYCGQVISSLLYAKCKDAAGVP